MYLVLLYILNIILIFILLQKHIKPKTFFKLISDRYINPTYDNNILFLRYWNKNIKKYGKYGKSSVYIKNKNSIGKINIFSVEPRNGFEDPRSFVFDENIFLLLASRNEKNDLFEMYISKYDFKNNSISPKLLTLDFKPQTHYKNLMSLVNRNKLYLIYSMFPEYKILLCDPYTGICKTSSINKPFNFPVNGGSKCKLWNNKYYCVVHKKDGNFYSNIIVELEGFYPFNILRHTNFFVLTDEGLYEDITGKVQMFFNFGPSCINFVSDIDIDINGNITFIYGWNDEKSYILSTKLLNFNFIKKE